MKPDSPLSHIQRWLQAVIVHPGGVAAGLQSSEARRELDVPLDEVESIITRSAALTSIERLEIYSRAYYARLIECLRSQFPVLAKVLGEDVFDRFAGGYLEQHPSHSYTLGRLGENFVDYLRETRPADDAGAAWPDLLIDLARLEWEFDQVFDGPGVEGQPLLAADQIRAIPADRWHAAKLVSVPCLRLLSLRYPVHEYYRAIRRGDAAAPPIPAATHLAITRREYVVRYFPLTAPQHSLLAALLQGVSIGEAVEAVAAGHASLDELANNLHAWFSLWTAEGFFLRIDQTWPKAVH